MGKHSAGTGIWGLYGMQASMDLKERLRQEESKSLAEAQEAGRKLRDIIGEEAYLAWCRNLGAKQLRSYGDMKLAIEEKLEELQREQQKKEEG